MADDAILHDLRDIAREVLLDDSLVLTRDMWANDIVGWSSIILVEMVLAAQDHFGIRIPAAEADKLRSIGDFVDLIARHQAGGS